MSRARESAIVIAIHDIAEDFREMQLAGHAQAAAEKYWSADIASIGPTDLSDGTPAIVRGLTAAREKLIRRLAQNVIDDIAIDGSFISKSNLARTANKISRSVKS